jgi:HicA-like toxin of HicAB toxin-antitoxin system
VAPLVGKGLGEGARDHQADRTGRLAAGTQKGSHRHFHHPIKPGTVTVAGHRNEDLRPKTLADIFRQAGLKR